MNIYESKFLKINYFQSEDIIELVWLSGTSQMTVEEYKKEHLNLLELILEHKPTKIIGNTKDLDFPISPEIQEWINTEILAPVLEAGINRMAVVVSPELITQLSIEQTMSEDAGVKFVANYFDNREEAKEWLLRV